MSRKLSVVMAGAALLGLAGLALAACATTPKGAALHTADISMDHYSGKWLEIARHPMAITNGCVAGYTTYSPGAKPGEIAIEDGCYKDTPSGKLKSIKARGILTDAGAGNAKLEARYPFFITFHYWVLYEAPDHSWFISATPDMKNLWIYTRAVPSKDELAVMVDKAKALGYDPADLEFPPAK